MSSWIIREGVAGEREAWALEHGLAGGGFNQVGDLTGCSTREDVRQVVEKALPGDPPGRVMNYTGQLWALRSSITPGDVVLMPMKTTKKLAIGVCTGGYHYRADDPDVSKRHCVSVAWKRDDISRAAIKDDLLNTINGAMTIFQAAKNNAEHRIRRLLEGHTDPGSLDASTIAPVLGAVDNEPPSDVVDPTAAPTLDAIRDRVRTHLIENFGKHKLTRLVADILSVDGYVCTVSPEGPDFGVDIIAGRGLLGLDSPTVIVEVKSEAGQIGAPVVRGLQGAMASHKADQGLLVAWGGLTKAAESTIRNDRLRIAVWDSEAVIDHLFEVYEKLPEDVRLRLPLKRTWVLDEDAL